MKATLFLLTAALIFFSGAICHASGPVARTGFTNELAALTNRQAGLAADEPLIPAPLNWVLARTQPGMTGGQVKALLAAAYPKVQSYLGDWDGMTGYIDFRLDERYSVSFSARNPPAGAPSESSAILGKHLLTYIFDHQRKHRLEVHRFQWDTPAEAQPKADHP